VHGHVIEATRDGIGSPKVSHNGCVVFLFWEVYLLISNVIICLLF
jgi:hypothetical protein